MQTHAQLHPAEPTVNLGDTSFLDGVAGPGYMVEEIAEGEHHRDSLSGVERSTLPAGSASHEISGLTHVAWLSTRTFLGGWYGVEFVQAVAHVNAGPGRVVTGAGDLTILRLLQWKDISLGRVRIAQRLALEMGLPTGQYHPTSQLNLSAHAFDIHPYYAITLFPVRRLETSWRLHYLWSATDHSSPAEFNAASTKASQAVHFNATVGFRFTKALWAGANGYLLNSVTQPRIDGRPLAGSPERVGALGPGLAWDLGHCILYANGYREFGAENRPAQAKLVLRLQWLPSRKGRQL